MEEEKEIIYKAERNNRIIRITRALKYAFFAERINGICRFSIQGAQLLPSTWINKLYGLCWIILYLGSYAAFMDLPTILDGSSAVVDVIDEVPCVLTLIQYITTVITTNILFSKINKDIITSFAGLDTKLLSASTDEFYRRERNKTSKFLILLVVSHVIICATDLLTDDEIDASEIIFLPLYLIQKLEIVVFCLKIEMIRSRLAIINMLLSKFLDEREEENTFNIFTLGEESKEMKMTSLIGRPSENNTKIRDLAMMYDTIGSICSMVNNAFNYQIFMTLVAAFVYIVITIWTSLYYYRTAVDNTGPLITIIIWCITALMTVATICFVCEKLRVMRNTTKILVNQLIMDYNLPKTMRVQAKAFMEVVEAWPLRIMVYDMFSVDITLMLKFISVSTTYLIVIIQISHLS